MATQTQAADRHTTVTTGWTNPTNAYATTGDNVYATATPAKSSTVNGDFGFPSLSLPAGATITAARLVVEWGMTAAVTGGVLGVQGRNNNVADTAAEVTQTATTEGQSTFTFGTKPSVTDFNTAGRVVARVRCSKGNTSTAMTGNLDFVRLEVDYSVTTSQTLTATASGTAVRTAKPNLIRAATATATALMARVAQRAMNTVASGTALTTKLIALVLPQGGGAQVSLLSLLLYQNVGTAPGVTATGTASVVTSRFYTKALAAVATGTATMLRLLSRVVVATAVVAATLTKFVTRSLAVAATGTATVVRETRRVLGTTATATATASRAVARRLTATSSPVASAVRLAQRTLTAVATGVASISTQITTGAQTFYLTLTAVATGTAAASRDITRALAAQATSTAALTRTAAKTVATDAIAVVLSVSTVARRLLAQAHGTAVVMRLRFLELIASAVGAAQLAVQEFIHGAYRRFERAGRAIGDGAGGVARMAREGVQRIRGTESRGSGRSRIGD